MGRKRSDDIRERSKTSARCVRGRMSCRRMSWNDQNDRREPLIAVNATTLIILYRQT